MSSRLLALLMVQFTTWRMDLGRKRIMQEEKVEDL
jgi:hypothetical protein